MRRLPADAARRLREEGCCVLPGPVPADALGALAAAYDRAMAEADAADRREGRTTVRVSDFVNRGSEFDSIYVYPPLLDACSRTIAGPYKLSALHGRTLLAERPAQELHVDFAGDGEGWTMVGFILMVDEFRAENGATRFVKGSHLEGATANGDAAAACGPAGSLIVYNGAVRHGHGANATRSPRRSVQGAFIRREARAAIDIAARMRAETLARIGARARYVLGLQREVE